MCAARGAQRETDRLWQRFNCNQSLHSIIAFNHCSSSQCIQQPVHPAAAHHAASMRSVAAQQRNRTLSHSLPFQICSSKAWTSQCTA
jgi:hypothetical protein